MHDVHDLPVWLLGYVVLEDNNLSLSAETVTGWMLEMCNVYFKHIVCEYTHY